MVRVINRSDVVQGRGSIDQSRGRLLDESEGVAERDRPYEAPYAYAPNYGYAQPYGYAPGHGHWGGQAPSVDQGVAVSPGH